ncbi:hypothetical protein OWM54_37495 [Myxococcus sp. MISCRS1]|nr:hypothetical protein [Myxococcus sp. MISCRS1]MCY1002859.1 hypothetical protein [Myxococcus sp. MISCRS1]
MVSSLDVGEPVTAAGAHARGEAVIAVGLVSVVTFLVDVSNPVPARLHGPAVTAALVSVRPVPVITEFARVEESVPAALGGGAGRIASITRGFVAIVASLSGVEESIAAAPLRAVLIASDAAVGVVITFFMQVHQPVSTAFEHAVRAASISSHGVAVVALFSFVFLGGRIATETLDAAVFLGGADHPSRTYEPVLAGHALGLDACGGREDCEACHDDAWD